MIFRAKWHHALAAFLGVMFVAYAQWDDPAVSNPGKAATVVLASLFFGLLWECILRLFRLLIHGRLTRE